MIVEAGRGPGQTMGESGWIFAVERRGGYPWQEGAANRNERPLVNTACARLISLAYVSHRCFAVLQPAPLPNSGEALSLPLFVHAHAGIPPAARLVLRLVAWSAVEVRRCRLKLADMSRTVLTHG